MMNFHSPTPNGTTPRISVIGIGGAGGNAVNNMIQSQLEGVEFIVANTDAQALEQSRTDRRIQLGPTVTQGLGAGARPDIGRDAAEETLEVILNEILGSNMLFITAGMGGGTGTGAAPVVARAARENGILTIGVVTKPFDFEGKRRMQQAEQGIEELKKHVDTLIVIPNQNLFRIASEKTTFADAFKRADEVLHSGVRSVTDLMIMPGMVNLDFADIKTVMAEMGKAVMGTGEGEGEKRALDAAGRAINNPLLDDTSMKGARAVLVNITGGMDITLMEVDEAMSLIRAEADPDANIVFGAIFDETLNGKVRISVVATGIEAAEEPPVVLTVPPIAAAVAAPPPVASARPRYTPRATQQTETLPFEPELVEVQPPQPPARRPQPEMRPVAASAVPERTPVRVNEPEAPRSGLVGGFIRTMLPGGGREHASSHTGDEPENFRPAPQPKAAIEPGENRGAAINPPYGREPRVSPQDRPRVSSQSDDEAMRDIPAFLRRQAN